MKNTFRILGLFALIIFLVSCGGAETFTVSFDSQGGTSVSAQQVLEEVSLNVLPILSNKENHTFLGWSKSLGGPVVSDLVITGNITLFAIFSENPKYTISFMNNDNLLTTQSMYANQRPSYTFTPINTAEWIYTFKGWSTSKNGTILNALPLVSTSATYYAVIEQTKQTYSVSFNSSGGSAVSSQMVEYGNQVDLNIEPSKEGFRFMGWSLTNNGEVIESHVVASAVTLYSIWLESIPLSDYLESLLGNYQLNPTQFIPEKLLPGGNEISSTAIDFSNFVQISQIPLGGYGEQWQLVLDNLVEASYFFNFLTVIDTLASSSIVAYQNYIDQNPETDGTFENQSSIYTYNISFEDDVIFYVLRYVTTLPLLGEQNIVIGISFNIETFEKVGYIEIGNAQRFAYEVLEDSYTLALEYAGVKKSYLSIENEEDMITGSIHEHLTVESVDIKSVAQFFIDLDYTQVVGNKASGLVGFNGVINETYVNDTGMLVGYEVNETLSILTFHSIWFNLSSITGINSVKYTSSTVNLITEYTFYVNGNNNAFESRNVGGITNPKQASRRFDIELRTMYFYTFVDSALVKVKYQIPMIFVQEEVLNTLAADIMQVNNHLTGIALNVSVVDLQSLMDAYDKNVPPFKLYKDTLTVLQIVNYIDEIKSNFIQ